MFQYHINRVFTPLTITLTPSFPASPTLRRLPFPTTIPPPTARAKPPPPKKRFKGVYRTITRLPFVPKKNWRVVLFSLCVVYR